jgi:hypothetical protein
MKARKWPASFKVNRRIFWHSQQSSMVGAVPARAATGIALAHDAIKDGFPLALALVLPL